MRQRNSKEKRRSHNILGKIKIIVYISCLFSRVLSEHDIQSFYAPDFIDLR